MCALATVRIWSGGASQFEPGIALSHLDRGMFEHGYRM